MNKQQMEEKKNVEIKWLKEEILPKMLRNGKLVDNFSDVKENTFKIHEITVDFISLEEAFMLTICYRLKLFFDYDGEKHSRQMVVKKTPALEKADYDAVGFSVLFGNEIHTYSNLLPALEKLSGEPFTRPKFRYSELRDNFAVIILDDFGADGWRVPKLRYNLSLAHALLSVKYLGEFHGMGFALKHTNPEEVAKLVSDLKEPRFNKTNVHPGWLLCLKTTTQRTIDATRKLKKDVTEDDLKALEKILEDYFAMGKHWVQPREPMTTLCHGDYLRNNIAYKYSDKEAENPTAAMMFDMQTVRFCSPMIDLTIFLLISTLTDTRQANFEQIFDAYAKALADKFTAVTKEPLPKHLSKENLLKEYVRFMPYGIACCASFLFMLIDPSCAPSLEENIDDEQIVKSAKYGGGEIYDAELSSQVKEFVDLAKKHNIEVSKIFNYLS